MTADQQEQIILRLEQSVSRISAQTEQNSKDIGELTTSIKSIAVTLDSKTSTNWGVVLSAVGVVALFVGGAWALVNTQIAASKDQMQAYIKADEARKQLIENIVIGELQASGRHYQDLIYDRLSTKEKQ